MKKSKMQFESLIMSMLGKRAETAPVCYVGKELGIDRAMFLNYDKESLELFRRVRNKKSAQGGFSCKRYTQISKSTKMI